MRPLLIAHKYVKLEPYFDAKDTFLVDYIIFKSFLRDEEIKSIVYGQYLLNCDRLMKNNRESTCLEVKAILSIFRIS